LACRLTTGFIPVSDGLSWPNSGTPISARIWPAFSLRPLRSSFPPPRGGKEARCQVQSRQRAFILAQICSINLTAYFLLPFNQVALENIDILPFVRRELGND
jgi:hypothetical protein